MISRTRILLSGAVLATAAAAAVLLGFGRFTSHAVQNPTISLDMVTSGTTYDETTNAMSVGSTENCLTSDTANAATHLHQAHLVIHDVEDLVGWQVRLNYIGDKMRPQSQNPSPFMDSTTGQSVGFTNLPIDAVTRIHRDVTPAQSIPPAPADNTNTPQTALLGALYVGERTFPVSPDTPAKPVSDDSSYSAPSGGVLTTISLQVIGNESGEPSLFMNLDDGSPNPVGSKLIVFTGTGTADINVASGALGDGFHGEGATCVPLDCVNADCPAATPTPTFCSVCTPTPTAPPTSSPTPTVTATPTTTPVPCVRPSPGSIPAAEAGRLVVDSTCDGDDASPGDGSCATSSGECTLRAAIQESNFEQSQDIIAFNIGDGPQTITPDSGPLPDVSAPVIIDGTTQPGYAGSPIIELNGAQTCCTNGLSIRAGPSTVRGLVINGFDSGGQLDTLVGNGILLASDSNTIEGNFLGLDITGQIAKPNTNGVSIVDASHNRIGGLSSAARNVASGNKGMGIKITGASVGNSLLGNYVGTDSLGREAVRNEYAGIWLEDDASDNLIGGKEAGAGNLISGNYSYGLYMIGPNVRRNLVQGNRVGTNAGGTNSVKNANGIVISYGSENTIGGPATGEGNLISGNDEGVSIGAPGATGNKVQGNLIGTDVTGSARLPNTHGGVSVGYGPGNLIGGPNPGEGNVISGNGSAGVAIVYQQALGNIVQGNLIGTDITGKLNLGNGASGVEILEAPGNMVGGSNAQSRNVIAGNGWGVVIHGAYATGNSIQGNRIGLDSAGKALPNITHGVYIYDRASGNSIGGTDPGAPNTIAYNSGDGVRVENAVGEYRKRAESNSIRGNSIHSNLGKGIEIVAGGNTEVAPPTVRTTAPASGTACPGCAVDVFSDDEDEGRIYHGSTVADATGHWIFPGAVAGPNVTATATSRCGTSEFSAPVPISTASPTPSATASPTPSPVTGRFARYEAYPEGSWPESVATGDFTGDGLKDVAMSTSYYASPNDWKVFLFVQQPDGTLDCPIPYVTHHGGGDTMALAAGDLNNDGYTDLALATVNGTEVFYQQSGTLQPGVLVSTGLEGDVDIADVNGDGLNDLVESYPIRLLLGTGSGFGAPRIISSQSFGEVELGDVTGDGRIDVVGTSGDVLVFQQQPDGNFSAPASYRDANGSYYNTLEVADVTGDHRQDVIATVWGNRPNSRLEVFPQNQAGTLDAPTISFTYDLPGAVEAADLNADGRLDAVVVHDAWQRVGVYVQDGVGRLPYEDLYVIPYGSYRPNGVAIGDINNDGAPDIAISDSNNGLVVLRQNASSAPTPTPTPTASPTATPTSTPSVVNDAAALKISLPNEGGASTPIDVRVQNLGDHSEPIGVYVDVIPPGGPSNPYGCTPSGRVLATTVTVAPGQKARVSSASLSFACADAAGARGKAFTIVAVANAHGDDAPACGPGQLQSMPCYNALASDDSNPSNNRITRSCCKAGQ